MGLAFADTVDGPYHRNNSGKTPPDLPGEDPWGWIDDETGVFHAVFHDGNGTMTSTSPYPGAPRARMPTPLSPCHIVWSFDAV